MQSNDKLAIIGRAESVDFPDQGINEVPARIDTGARTSSLWACDIRIENDKLKFKLFAPESEFYSGDDVIVDDFDETVVSSSIGAPQKRFKIVTSVRIGGKRIKAKFTLADRSTQVYPVLIGRNSLRGKFVVNVKTGTVLKEREKNRSAELKMLLDDTTKGGL